MYSAVYQEDDDSSIEMKLQYLISQTLILEMLISG